MVHLDSNYQPLMGVSLHWSVTILNIQVYIMNGIVTRKKLDNRSNIAYFVAYATTTGVILYWKPNQMFYIHIAYHAWFVESTPMYPLSIIIHQCICNFDKIQKLLLSRKLIILTSFPVNLISLAHPI